MTTPSSKITVMLVDDSAIIRGALARILDRHDDIEIVAKCADGQIGVDGAKEHKPDICILDIEMPVMDGLTALPKILQDSPRTKVIMFSTLTGSGAETSVKALSLGAVECMLKPSSASGAQHVDSGSSFEETLLRTIRGLAPILKRRTSTATQSTAPSSSAPSSGTSAPSSWRRPTGAFTLHQDPMTFKGKPSLIAIGSSTGGPQALFEVIKNMTGFDVPIVITQHMPATFTRILAEHIEQKTGIKSQEGADGMALKAGEIFVAPGDYHMTFQKEGIDTVIKLDQNPPVNFCRPAVDPMFESALDIYGNKMLSVILTGMGNDGLNASKKLVESGVRLIAQDEETSVVWGMPGAVAQAGICSAVLPLQDIGPSIRQAVIG